jgi:hypothetical protein
VLIELNFHASIISQRVLIAHYLLCFTRANAGKCHARNLIRAVIGLEKNFISRTSLRLRIGVRSQTFLPLDFLQTGVTTIAYRTMHIYVTPLYTQLVSFRPGGYSQNFPFRKRGEFISGAPATSVVFEECGGSYPHPRP